jgi:hypothetical protein
MIFNDEIVFIHNGKTGGMSCSKYLLSVLKPPIYNCHVDALKIPPPQMAAGEVIPITTIGRHCTLTVASELIQRITQKPVSDRKKVFVVIRNPYTLEYSYYRHLQKPRVIERRIRENPELIKLAQGNFKEFSRKSGYHQPGVRQEDYFLVEGKMPRNIEIIKHENLEHSFKAAVSPFVKVGAEAYFPHLNKSGGEEELIALLDDELKEIIYQKHQYIFDNFYPDERP